MTLPSLPSSADKKNISFSPNCPCGSGKDYALCCKRLITGKIQSFTPEELMRSRYTAYVIRDVSYLLRTWHPSTRPPSIDPDTIPQWNSLQIVETNENDATGQGTVEFIAKAKIYEKTFILHEKSRFIKDNDGWLYIDGEMRESRDKPGRNAPCPCGSGKKFKKCCEA